MARNTLGEIVRKTKVVGLIYTVHKRRRMLGMLGREFLVFMRPWTIDKKRITHLSLRWISTLR